MYSKFNDYELLESLNPGGMFEKFIIYTYSSPEGQNLKLRNGVEVREMQRGRSRYLHLASYIRCLAGVVRREGIDAVHAKDPYLLGFAALCVSKLTGTPYCISIHADYDRREEMGYAIIPRYFGSLLPARLIEKLVYRWARLVFPIRESMVPALRAKGCPPEKIRVFPHGIDLGPFEKPTGVNTTVFLDGIDPAKKVIAMGARFDIDNYIYDYVEIARRLRSLRDDWIMVLAGEGQEYATVRELLREESLTDMVLLPGYIPHSEMIALWLRSCLNICLMGGFSLIEACASGRPVISYDVEWHSEIIEDRVSGCLIDEGDVKAVVETVSFLMDNPRKAEKIGAAGRENAFSRFNLERSIEVKRACYKELVR